MNNPIRLTLAGVVTLTVTACTSAEDVAMNESYQKYNSYAEQKRMDTIAEIAKQGEGGVIAAALLMQDALKSGNTTQAPRTNADRVLDGVKTIVPATGNALIGVGQIAATVYAADVQKDIAVAQSDNNKEVAINRSDNDAEVVMHTNDTLAGVAEVTIVKSTDTTVERETKSTVSSNN